MAGEARLGLNKRRNAGKGRKAGRQEWNGDDRSRQVRNVQERKGRKGRGRGLAVIGRDWRGMAGL